HREADDDESEVVEDDGAIRWQPPAAEADRRHRDAAQPVVAAGPVGQMEADEVEELREGQREHREVDAAAAQAEEPDDRAAEHRVPPHPRRRSPFHSSNPASPSRPLGRNSSTSAMKTKTMISASFGAKNVVRPTIWPIRSPEMTAPSRLPMPPTTTTTNDSMMMVTPISAYAPRIGPARIPARPASPVPMPNTRNQMRPTSKPSARTIIGSREPA